MILGVLTPFFKYTLQFFSKLINVKSNAAADNAGYVIVENAGRKADEAQICRIDF